MLSHSSNGCHRTAGSVSGSRIDYILLSPGMAREWVAAALKAKGYPYRYVFAEAAGHTDGRVTRQTLPAALEWLWEGYADRGKG